MQAGHVLLRRLQAQGAAQMDDLICWAPVALGFGVALYFGWPIEPGQVAIRGSLILSVLFVLSGWVWPRLRLIPMTCALMLLGFGLAGVRSHHVAAPVLEFRYYGPIEGRVIAIDRSQSDAVRLTLDRVVLLRMDPLRVPDRVRISLHGAQEDFTPEPGQIVLTTGHLSPPGGPVEPGGFDFQRMAWFRGLGAVGYTRNLLVLGEVHRQMEGLGLSQLRRQIGLGVTTRLPGESGAFAAAILTGDRSGISAKALADLRSANLAHLLAISGMHMGILAGFVFAALRYGMALSPWVALRWPTRKIAAMGALLAAAFYLGLSGGSVSTQRAFIMVAVILGAVLCDRRALTLRAVAIAALIVLTLRPEALFGPGFQMSFAATTALVAVFSALRPVNHPVLRGASGWAISIFISSLVAGLATAPFAAYHFNQIAQLGLLANLLCVPLMGALVMPAAVVAALLWPIGLEAVGLWAMDLGLRWILFVAEGVAAQDGALRHVATPPALVLCLIALGGLFCMLWKGSGRGMGVAPLCLGLILWQDVRRPELLVAETGSLIGVMTPVGRDLSKARGEGFAATSWLENDGAPVDQEEAYFRPGLIEEGRSVRAEIGGQVVLNVRGATALAALNGCGGAHVLITNQEDHAERPCQVYDIVRLRQTGALAAWEDADGLRFETARAHAGERLWNSAPLRHARLHER